MDSLSGFPIIVNPYIPEGEVWLFNKNIPARAFAECRNLEELAKWMAENRMIVHAVNVGGKP